MTKVGGVFCINDNTVGLAQDFQDALSHIDIVENPLYNADAEVRLIAGTYIIPDDPATPDGSTLHFHVTTSHTLEISGGWEGNCSTQVSGPSLTILQGGTTQNDQGGVLYVEIEGNTDPATVVDISNLTIQDGSSYANGGGFYLNHTPDTAEVATINMSNCQIINNVAADGGGGLYIDSGSGDTILVNNVYRK